MKSTILKLIFRVPMINASLIDCVFEVKQNTTKEEVNKLLKEASKNKLKIK